MRREERGRAGVSRDDAVRHLQRDRVVGDQHVGAGGHRALDSGNGRVQGEADPGDDDLGVAREKPVAIPWLGPGERESLGESGSQIADGEAHSATSVSSRPSNHAIRS